MNKVTDKDILDIAEKHKYEAAAIQAVYEIESNGSGFSLVEGIHKPKILFEGHVFWKELEKIGIDPSKKVFGNENVLYPKWTRKFYQSTQSGEYARLEKARAIHNEAANKSASWGMFQIMGMNHHDAGYETVGWMVDHYSTGEKAQLDSFIRFITAQHLDVCLKESANELPFYITRRNEKGQSIVEEVDRWEYFAYRYNGAGYEQNKYHIKLKAAYEKARRESHE